MVTDKVSPQSPLHQSHPPSYPVPRLRLRARKAPRRKASGPATGPPRATTPRVTEPQCRSASVRNNVPGSIGFFAFRYISAHDSDTKVNKPKTPRYGIRLPVPSDACAEKSNADIVPIFWPPASSSLRSTNREACQNTTPQQLYHLGGLSRWLQLKLPVSSAKTGSGGGSDPRPIHRSHPPTSLTLRSRSSVLGALPAFEHPPTCRATHSRAPSFRETPSFHIGEDART